MNQRKYLPKGYVAVDADELENLRRKAELYDMYARQARATSNGVFLPKDEYNELLKKAEGYDHMIELENKKASERMQFESAVRLLKK